LKMGLNHAFFRHYYEAQTASQRRRIVGSVLIFLLAVAALTLGSLYLIAPQLSCLLFKGNQNLAGLFRLMLCICFFEVVSLIPDSILRANFQSAKYSAINIVALAAQMLLISYLVIFVEASARSVLIGKLAGSAFEAFVFLLMVRRDLSLSFSYSELKQMLAFGFPLIFGQLSFTLFVMIDRFFLEAYRTSAEVGVYSLSNNIVSIVAVLVTVPFSQVWTVMRFSVMKEAGANEYYSRVLTYIVLVSMFLALLVAAVAGDGIQLYGLKKYWAASTIIPLLAFSAVLDSASRVLNIGITLHRRTVYAPAVTTAALLLNIALNFLLIPPYGIVGATLSTLISYIAFCALRFWVSNLFFKVRYEWKRVFIATIIGAILIAAFYLLDYLRELSLISLNFHISMLIKTTLALSFPLALLGLGFYDDKEKRKLKQFRAKLLAAFGRAPMPQIVTFDAETYSSKEAAEGDKSTLSFPG
jgi:O-antigen/teichoic acid export membrane protein